MKSAAGWVSAALVLLAAAAARPAAAQECLGAPRQGGTYVALGEVVHTPAVTMFGARAGREIGEWLAAHFEAARLGIGSDELFLRQAGRGNRIGATAVAHFSPEDVSLCSFASLRRTDVRSEFQPGPADASGNPYWQNTVTGVFGSVGLAAGRSVDFHADWTVVPSASLAIGWTQNETRSRCIRSCGEHHLSTPGYSEGGLQLEPEIGSLLRFRRVFVSGALRWVLGGMDPSLQHQVSIDGDQAMLTVIRAGVTF